MDNKAVFAAGTAFGVVIGAVATYFATRKHFAEKAADAIEEYAEYADEKIQRVMDKFDNFDAIAEDLDFDYEEETIKEAEDEAIKVYHKYAPQIPIEELAKKAKESEAKPELDENKKKEDKMIIDFPKGIEEVDEEVYLEDDGYERVTLHYVTHENKLYYGYETDNEELAEIHYNRLKKDDIIGPVWRWSTDYTDNESGVGYTYVKNDNLETIFEVVFNVDLEQEPVEVTE